MQSATEKTTFDRALAREVLAGLTATPKTIAPKFFYDQRGSELFTAITEQPEYYIPATERQIVGDSRAAICARIGAQRRVLEPGAGSCEKIRWLLPDLDPAVYVPMDISAEHLQASAAALRADFPALSVEPVVCDHSAGFVRTGLERFRDPVFFYPGSSIGNIDPAGVVEFLGSMRALMVQRGGLLIGVDTRKSAAVLNAAYNDAAGVTAAFNLNMLSHLNALLDGNFDLDTFEHVAFYNDAAGRIEMHLRSRVKQRVRLAGQTLEFAAGEQIHTENSYKYDPAEFAGLAEQAGLSLRETWQDERGYFAVMYFSAGRH